MIPRIDDDVSIGTSRMAIAAATLKKESSLPSYMIRQMRCVSRARLLDPTLLMIAVTARKDSPSLRKAHDYAPLLAGLVPRPRIFAERVARTVRAGGVTTNFPTP